jgi:hypothetical protein
MRRFQGPCSRASRLGAVALLALAAAGCGGDDKLGSLMLAISTDMYVDKDIDRMDVIVQPETGPTQATPINLFPAQGGLFLPGTFAIVEGKTDGEFVRVRIIARQQNEVRVVREVAVRLPKSRTAVLPMPIQWLCDGHVAPEGQLYRSNCPENETCIAGTCQPDAVDENTLEDYVAADVFGGGNATGGGTCFDTLSCFESTTEPPIDLDTCELATAASDDLNVGLMLPTGGDGHCTNSGCWVPLDASSLTGWSGVDGGARVKLPAAACEHVRNGGASVRVSHDCPSKPALMPTCGPWTLVGTEPGEEAPIEGAPLVVTSVSLATELERAGVRLARTVADACAAITGASAPALPSAADVTTLCNAARDALSPLDWYHVTTRCWPDHTQQLACERACDDSCDPGTVETRCEPAAVVGTCDAACESRQCLGTEARPLDCAGACDGSCAGSCNGNCVGQCDGVCATPDADGYCAGVCVGTCTGLCQGRCEGSCQGTCDGDPNLPVAACNAGTQCRGGCAGEYSSEVCQSVLLPSSCTLDADCAADCRAMGHINVACEPSRTWIQPAAGLDGARATTIAAALADLLPVRDVEGAAILEEATRIGQNLSDNTQSSGDSLGRANALIRVRTAVDRLRAATQAAGDVIEAAGDPRPTPGPAAPGGVCEPTHATGAAPLIDDFEDGNSQCLVNDGRDGSWHVLRDNSPDGQLSLQEPPVPESGGREPSARAMHVSGSNFTEWGAGVGLELRQQSLPYDASAHAGLKFWARGTGPVRVIFVQQDLASGTSCSSCGAPTPDCGQFYSTNVTLNGAWTEYTVPWAAVTQDPVGVTPFAPDQLTLIKFESPAAESFEFWLDDVSFY